MTELVMKQGIFSKYLGKLIEAFPDHHITFGECWRSDETQSLYAKEGKGVRFSCHELRLAVDLNLWVQDKVSKSKTDFEPLGEFWKNLPKLCPTDIEIVTAWGGDFKSLCDFYHFSISHNGIR